MLKNLKATGNETLVKGRRTEAGCNWIQFAVDSVTEVGLEDGHLWAQSLEKSLRRLYSACEPAESLNEWSDITLPSGINWRTNLIQPRVRILLKNYRFKQTTAELFFFLAWKHVVKKKPPTCPTKTKQLNIAGNFCGSMWVLTGSRKCSHTS